VCVRTTVVSVAVAFLALIPIVSGLTQAAVILVILATLTLSLFMIRLPLFLANACFSYAGALCDAEATHIGRWRHHAVMDGLAPG
jgi:hypothetical protein